MKYDFYDSATGIFTGRNFFGSSDAVASNTPAGCGVATGAQDTLSQKVDLQTGAIISYQPPAPQNGPWNTWQWNQKTKRWQSVMTFAWAQALRIAEVQAAIENQEKMQARPGRELITALRLALPAPLIALNKLAAIELEITRLRGLRTNCAAAGNQAQLDAVARPT